MSKLRILVVDDDPDFADGFADILEFEGHEVEIANSGTDALRALDVFRFDLAFMDVSMPAFSGFEALSEIVSRKSDMKVVMVTGHRDADLGKQAASHGAHDLIFKPFRPEQILKIIENISVH